MSIFLAIGVIITIFIITMNMGKGTKSEDGDFVLEASAGNDGVAIILGKIKKSLKGSVFIPNGVTTIGYEVFSDMGEITDIKIHEKVKIIGQRSFKNCIGISSLYVGEGVEKIGDEAFDGCKGMTELTIGPRVKAIKSNAFRGCENIRSIKIEGYNVPDIFTTTFDEAVKRLCVLYVQSGCIEAFSRAPGWNDFLNIKEVSPRL